MAGPEDSQQDHEDVAVLLECASRLDILRHDWDALTRGDRSINRGVLEAQSVELRRRLRSLPFGDPSDTTLIHRDACDDPVVCAHGAVTKACLLLRLSRLLCWASHNPATFLDTAVLRLRLLDLQGAHDDVQRAAALGVTDSRLQGLGQSCARMLAPWSHAFLDMETHKTSIVNAEAFCHIRDVFLNAGYNERLVLCASKANTLTEFISVEDHRADFEQHLIDSASLDDSMEVLADLIRIFLLHDTIALMHLVQIFGVPCCQLLLLLRAVTAINGDTYGFVAAHEAARRVEDADNCDGLCVFANVAMWPLEDNVLIATDFEQTFYPLDAEPVMYLSEDSLALAAAAPQQPCVQCLLDMCCGCGIQGILALKYYAKEVAFVDLNPRALIFVHFNLLINGLADKPVGLHLGNVYDAMPEECMAVDLILANPPFIPNPQGIASGACAMFGDGGETGERILAEIIAGAPRVLAPGGRLCFVAVVTNVAALPDRLQTWLVGGTGQFACDHAVQGFIWHGTVVLDDSFRPTNSMVESHRFGRALNRLGIESVSKVLCLLSWSVSRTCSVQLEMHSPLGSNCISLVGESREDLWRDHAYLRKAAQLASNLFSSRAMCEAQGHRI